MSSAAWGVSLVVLAIKFTYLITGSLALYSDALESIINVATSIAAIIAIRIAARPPDAEHPYGYHKAEYMSAVVIGALIIAAALAILHEAYGGFLAPRAIDAPWTGLTIGMVATILNAGWGVPHRADGDRGAGRMVLPCSWPCMCSGTAIGSCAKMRAD